MTWKSAASVPDTEKVLTPTPSVSVTVKLVIFTAAAVLVMSGIVVEPVLKVIAVGAVLDTAEGA